MKYIVACLMAVGFYGLTFGQSDTTSRTDTTGMGEGSLSCYMVDDETFICSMEEENQQGTDEGLDQRDKNLNEEEETAPQRNDDVLKEEDIQDDEGSLNKENDATIQGREEDVTTEPSTRENEIPEEPERESDEGILPQNNSDENSDQMDNSGFGRTNRPDSLNTY